MAIDTDWKTFTAADGTTWRALQDGRGWTAARILRLRTIAGEIEGCGGPMPRERFARLTDTSERSLARWEKAESAPMAQVAKGLAAYMKKLSADQRVQVIAV